MPSDIEAVYPKETELLVKLASGKEGWPNFVVLFADLPSGTEAELPN